MPDQDEQQPYPEIKTPEAPDIPWVDTQYPFDGQWMPDLDPALIGPRNFANLLNLRYNDRSIEGVSGYTNVNNGNAITTYTNLTAGFQLRTNRTTTSFNMVRAEDSGGQGRIYQNTTAIGVEGAFDTSSNLDIDGNAYWQDTPTSGVDGRFSTAPQGSIIYCNGSENAIYSGFEHRIAAAFLVSDVPSLTDPQDPKDVTDLINNSLATNYAEFDATWDKLIIFTTRPIQGLKAYLNAGTTDVNGILTVKPWCNNAGTIQWGDDLIAGGGADNTQGGVAQSFTSTGTITFSTHTSKNVSGIAALKTVIQMHYQELYLYAYLLEWDQTIDAQLYHLTCDPAMQEIQNVWDGVYRQPIQFQVFNAANGTYEDYTLHVNQSSDINAPVGGQLDGLLATEHIIIMFEEQMSAIRFTMLGNLINIADAQFAAAGGIKYWDGNDYQNITFTDGTLDVAEDSSFAQSGLISWVPPTDEEKQTLFGSVGYAYKFIPDQTFTGTKGSTAEVLVDFVTGVPALLEEIKPFAFSTMFQNRVMLGAFNAGDEGNRMDFSVTNAPDVYNGIESSMDGVQSLFFGGVEPLTCAIQLYNRFGASIFSMLLALKQTEVYLMVGENPANFVIYPVSQTVGCPAPHTLATAEVGLEVGKGLTRNIAIWLSHYGPMMFDGALLVPLIGVNNFFDPNEDDYVSWASMSKARGWVDQTYKEYNLLIPSGDGQTTNNLWLVYDLLRKKWFKKDSGAADFPQTAWNVMNPATGEQAVYAGTNSGMMIHLEEGTSWACTYGDPTDGQSITQNVKVGDFFPSNNIWDATRLRKFKLIAKKITNSTSGNLNVNYFGGAANQAANVIFQDSDAGSGITVDFEDTDETPVDGVNEIEWESATATTLDLTLDVGLERLVRLIMDLNEYGWVHSFEFELTTNDVNKGFQPIVWGLRYRVERKDETSNTVVI
jgi:hypothetical protein